MGIHNAAADLPAMKTNPKVRPTEHQLNTLAVLISGQQFIFFTDFDGTITLQDSES
jgi:hypothetical protein